MDALRPRSEIRATLICPPLIKLDGHRTVGMTDSELAFCPLLERLRPHWSGREWLSLESRREAVEGFAAELRELGPANFLYCDGTALFAHGDVTRAMARTVHQGCGGCKCIAPPVMNRVPPACASRRAATSGMWSCLPASR